MPDIVNTIISDFNNTFYLKKGRFFWFYMYKTEHRLYGGGHGLGVINGRLPAGQPPFV